MFGFVRPLRAELKVKDYELFKAQYCGLCHALKKRCGAAGRFIVNYDFTFLAMLLSDETQICRRRCIASPLQKKNCCTGGAVLERTADMSVILAYMKLSDGVNDGEGIKYRLARLALRRGFKKAARENGDFYEECSRLLGELSLLEGKSNASIDENADKFALILSAAAAGETEGRKRVLSQLLYQLGRYVYIADAVCDLDEDKKAGRFNAVTARYGAEPDMEAIERMLAHTQGLIASAFELLDINEFTPVLENVVYLGIPAVTGAVLDGSYKSLLKSERNKNRMP